MRVLSTSAVAAIAVALVAVTASAAPRRDALVRPGGGIGEVSLGMTYAEVVQALGRPHAVNRRRRVVGMEYVEYAWNLHDWTVALRGRIGSPRVVKVATGLRRERTRAGSGVGSSTARLRRRERARCGYPRLKNNVVDSYFCLAGRPGRQVVFAIRAECALRPGTYYTCTRFRSEAYEVVVASPDLMRELRFK